MLVAQEGVAPQSVCQEEAAAVAVAGPACLLLALPCTASPKLDGCNEPVCCYQTAVDNNDLQVFQPMLGTY